MSKRLCVTGKAFFLFKTGVRIWVDVFLIFCAVYSTEEKFVWEFLSAFPAVCTKSSCTLVGKAAHSPAHSCHQHPLGTRASKVHEFGAFFPSSTRRKETCNPFPHYIFHWRQISLMMQKTDMKARLISALPSTSAPTVPQRKEKTETFAFQLLISSPPSADTDTVLMQGFTFIIWKAARQVKNMQMWPIKKDKRFVTTFLNGILQQQSHTTSWEQTVSSWSLFLKPDLLMCHTGNHS